MFLNLRKILIICIIFILIFFITNSFNFMDSQDIQWIVNHWVNLIIINMQGFSIFIKDIYIYILICLNKIQMNIYIL